LTALEVEKYADMEAQFGYKNAKTLFKERPWVLEKYRSQFYKVKKSFQLISQNAVPAFYDVVVRMRTDLDFEKPISIADFWADIQKDKVVVAADVFARESVRFWGPFCTRKSACYEDLLFPL